MVAVVMVMAVVVLRIALGEGGGGRKEGRENTEKVELHS